ncbi:MAG: tetratricopeptide repeat protein, partial [Stackebrandtia sp.]
ETALAVFGLGAVARYTDRFGDAASLFRDSATALNRIDDKHGEGYARWALAGAFIELENFDGADEQLQLALEASRSVGDFHREAHVQERFGTLHNAQGNQPEAVACLELALSMFDDIGDKPCMSEVQHALSEITSS